MKVRVWDLPTRLFHWLLAAAVASAWLSGDTGGNWLAWHGRIGLLIIGLISFRLTWGLVGPTYARFSNFWPTPAALRAYLSGRWRGVGHNPLGALSVLGLLGLVAVQAASGLGALNDDTGHAGPLYPLVSVRTGELATWLHHQALDLLLPLAGLHVAAVLFHGAVKKDNLVWPMITGDKEVEAGQPARGGDWRAVAFSLALATAVTWGTSGVWYDPPAPPPTETPAW